jgi:hypothetical protein
MTIGGQCEIRCAQITIAPKIFNDEYLRRIPICTS